MSKDTPEVGDVFKTKRFGLCKIIETNKRFSMCLIKDDDSYCMHLVLNTYITRCGKLLGNNSITLNDLFKTENEE